MNKPKIYVKHVPAKPRNHKKIGWIGLAIVIILGIVLAGVLYQRHIASQNQKQKAEAARAKVVFQTVSNQISNGKQSQSIDELKKFLDEAPGDDNKYEALSALGTAYMINQQYDQALDAFKQAEALRGDKTTGNVYTSMARIYQLRGDKQQAIDYYNKAIVSIKNNKADADDALIPQYQAAIKSLEGGQ